MSNNRKLLIASVLKYLKSEIDGESFNGYPSALPGF